MNSMIRSRLLAAALTAVALVGCNAVEDVRESPFIPVPAEGVVLQGKVTGPLGNKRSITLMNNGNSTGAISVSATLGTPFTPFTFGIVPVGSTYNVAVKANPFGKICTVSGGSGTVTTAEALNIVVNCVNDPAVTRFAVRVGINSAFATSQGAKVTLTTEEGVFEKTPGPTDTFVQFDSSIFHNVLAGVTNLPVFTWTVTATNTVGSTLAVPLVNKCLVTNGTNPAGASPTTNVGFTAGGTSPVVGTWTGTTVTATDPCAFTIGGTVAYSYPTGTTPPATAGALQAVPSGLDLELRDVQGNVVQTLAFTGNYATSTASGAAGTSTVYSFPTPARSNPRAVYDVAVKRHPTNTFCVVANGGGATLGVATANITNAHVVCRLIPAGTTTNAKLKGTYGFYNGVSYNAPATPTAGTPTATLVASADGTLTTTTVTVSTVNTRTTYVSTTNPGLGGESRGQTIVRDLLTRTVVQTKPPTGLTTTTSDVTVATTVTTTNTSTTRNFLTFFDDGTFLAGAHGTANNQIEHGFYTYDSVAKVITLALVTDTTVGGTDSLLNTGISGIAGAASVNNFVTATMRNVTKAFLGDRGSLSVATAGGTNGSQLNLTTPGNRWSTWVMLEPKNTDGQTEGPWVTQDHRQTWSYDNNTTLGYHVGVNGGASNLQDACFTYEDFRATSGFYTRRGGLTGCLEGLAGVVPIDIPSAVGTPNTFPAQLPGFIGRVPGSETAFDGRSPSPIYYAIGTKNTLASVADPAFFPAAQTTPAALAWCNTEIYALRSSLNGVPINVPVYFCRERTGGTP